MLKLFHLRCEYFEKPMSVDNPKPRFSWKIDSDSTGVKQTAYQIVVEGMWDSGKVADESSVWIEYEGKPLEACTRYSYQVRIWDNQGNVSDYEQGSFETSLKKWTAELIGVREDYGDVCPVYEAEKNIINKVKSARIYATAYGVYEIKINGRRVSDVHFAPGFTVYDKRLQYQTYDATEYIKEGINHISIEAGKCWFKWYGDKTPSVLMEIHITYENGEFEIFGTGDDWTVRRGNVLFSHIYDGETYDARPQKQKPEKIVKKKISKDNIIAQQSEAVRITERIKPVYIINTPNGETVIDFGQNMVGWVELKVSGGPGSRVIFSHAEVLDKNGNFYTENLRGAKQRVQYILKGEGVETYHSLFTFYGFRYIRIEEFPCEVRLENFVGLVVHTDMERTGWFSCSNELVNKLYHSVIWGQKGNFLDLPTDCPQRDERLGWTGDAQVFVSTAARNMNVNGIFRKWLGDLKAEQTAENGVTRVVPDVRKDGTPSSGWGDAATICPWEIYRAYGDKRILERQYNSMKLWVEYIRNQGDNPYLWNTGFHYGDWVALDAKEGSFTGATSKDLIATAYYAYSTLILKKTAGILEYSEDEKKYEELYNNIVKAFQNEFITPSGRLVDNTQTAYALVLKFDLATDRKRSADALARLIEENDGKLTTGFLGTPYLCNALSENGYPNLAYGLLLQEGYPSWLYSVKKGGTTIWEHWDGIKEDGEFWNSRMNSFNHYAYGVIADWLFGTVAGINIDEAHPGYKHIIIKPITNERLDYAEATIDTMYGLVSSRWERVKEGICYSVTIPHNTTATMIFPEGNKKVLGSGKYIFDNTGKQLLR